MRTAILYAVSSADFPRIVRCVVGDIAQIPHGAVRPEDVQASFCEVLVDEWIAQGVTYAALAPGSRSTPLALALMRAQERVESFIVDVFHDERSAAFAALGAGVEPQQRICMQRSSKRIVLRFP
jgi:hypothetical protein